MSYRLLVPSVLIIVTIAFLISLGFWQLDRADQKRTIEASIQKANTGTIEIIVNEDILLDQEYYMVRLQGSYISDEQFIYDNQIVDQASGYYVLTPFVLSGQSKAVMINRGFIPWNGRRDKLADIDVEATTREIKVQVSRPIKRCLLYTSPSPRDRTRSRMPSSA